MDQKIMLVVLGVAALAFASLAFATNGQGNAQGWQGNENATGCSMRAEMAGNGNGTCVRAGEPRVNSTEREAFKTAVETGDFAAATKLHEEYGFGGQVFEKLNETTFAKFSQIANLESQLSQELGLNATGRMPPLLDAPCFGNKQGMKSGRGMMGQEFAKGMRNRFNQETNQPTQQ